MSFAQSQRGVSLIIVLVVLAVILVGSLALLRSSEVSSLVGGNVSFKEAATQATDIGISDAAKTLNAMVNMSNRLPLSWNRNVKKISWKEIVR